MAKGIRVLFYVIGVCIPFVLAIVYGHEEGENFLHSVATSVALIGIMILSFQVLLAGRFRWVERPFGLDVLIRYHRKAAVIALLLLLAHPALLMAASGNLSLIESMSLPWYIWMGKVTLFLLLLNVGISLFQGKLHLSFEKWRFMHDGAAVLIILFAFIHSGFTGHDIQTIPILQKLWVVIPVLFLILFFYHLVINPWRLRQHLYRVEKVRRDAKDVFTLTFAPQQGQPMFAYFPGQFHFITLYRKNLPVEEHHWTISSSPMDESGISSTIKELGDFTKTIGQTIPGDTALIDGPYGRFSYLFYPDEKDLVFIGGGIGITPLMSMLRYMHEKRSKIPVLLLYASQNEILFRDELAEMEKEGRFPLQIVHVLSHPSEAWKGERGHIDKSVIEKYVGPSLEGKSFYLSGPKGLVAATVAVLNEMGVLKDNLHVEYFTFLE